MSAVAVLLWIGAVAAGAIAHFFPLSLSDEDKTLQGARRSRPGCARKHLHLGLGCARKHLHLGLGSGAHSESKEWFCAKDMSALRP
jgi:hypothetical protein